MRGPYRRRRVALSDVDDVVHRVRSETAPRLRTAVRTQLAAIRNELAEEDRALLILRVDRGLSWKEIARVIDAPGSWPRLIHVTQTGSPSLGQQRIIESLDETVR